MSYQPTRLGASHQTGWTAAIARFMQLFAVPEFEQVVGRKSVTTKAPAAKASTASR
jgi:hypothetical protein